MGFMSDNSLFICSGNSNPELTHGIIKSLNTELGNVHVSKFPDGEIHVKCDDNVSGKDVFIIQSICRPSSDNIIELLMLIDVMKRLRAGRITVIIPYYGYGRQDRIDDFGVSIFSKTLAKLISDAGSNRIVTLDLHAPQIVGFCNIPVDNLRMSNIIANDMNSILDSDNHDLIVVAPDIGGVKSAEILSKNLDVGLAIITKNRIDSNNVCNNSLVGSVTKKNCILVDDIVSTAGTITTACETLIKANANKVIPIITHCLLNDKGFSRLSKSPIERFITTDSVPKLYSDIECRFNVLRRFGLANIFAEVISDIHNNKNEYIKYIFDKYIG